MTKKVSLNPKDASYGRELLDIYDRRTVQSIHEMPFGDFVEKYQAPKLTKDDYLDIRYVPDVWARVTDQQPRSHLFLYTLCNLQADDRLVELRAVRAKALEVCDEKGDEASLMWLGRRPRYQTLMASSEKRLHFPAWNEEFYRTLVTESTDLSTTARIMLIVYSSKVLLESGIDLQGYKHILNKEVDAWTDWVEREISEITGAFARFF